MQTIVDGPTALSATATWLLGLSSGLIGAALGAWAALYGVRLQIAHQVGIARRILLRRAAGDLTRVLHSSFGHWTHTPDVPRHADGSYLPGPGSPIIVPLLSATDLDLAPIPREMLERLFAVDRELEAIFAQRTPTYQDDWPRELTPSLTAYHAEARRVRLEVESLLRAIRAELGDPLVPLRGRA